MEEIEQEPRYRPEALSSLCKATHFSKEQVKFSLNEKHVMQ